MLFSHRTNDEDEDEQWKCVRPPMLPLLAATVPVEPAADGGGEGGEGR